MILKVAAGIHQLPASKETTPWMAEAFLLWKEFESFLE
jgi:hypothetical protein